MSVWSDSHRIAAFGPVASAFTTQVNGCEHEPPAPVVAFHGTADTITPYGGGKVWIAPEPFPNIPEWIATWGRRNGCAPDAVDVLVSADVTRREYANCAGDASVQLYTIEGAGHQWFGGMKGPEWLLGPFSRSIDTTRVMWEFLQKHPLKKSVPT